MTSRIIVENHLACWFDYLMCQQLATTGQLYSWQITKVCLQTTREKSYNDLHTLLCRKQ